MLFTGHSLAAAFDNASDRGALSLRDRSDGRQRCSAACYFGTLRCGPGAGHLVYIHQGSTLFAVGFDLETLEDARNGYSCPAVMWVGPARGIAGQI